MKHTVKNLINSPYDVITVDGPERIPARGEMTAEFDERSLAIMRQMGYFKISEVGADRTAAEPERDPLDHDGDGRKGGSLPKEKRGPGRPKKEQA